MKIKTMKRNPKNGAGFAMIEVMVSLTIVAIMIITFQTLMAQAIKINRANQTEFQANLYLREEVEIAKVLEQSGGWDKLDTACTSVSKCHFVEVGNSWDKSLNEETTDIYTRGFYVESINADTKKITALISWNNTMNDRTLTLETYVYQDIY